MQDTSKNVAFGYLSALLGNFALLPSLAERISSRQPRKTLHPIVESIEEFMNVFKTHDMEAAAQDEPNLQVGMTARLETLLSKLARR